MLVKTPKPPQEVSMGLISVAALRTFQSCFNLFNSYATDFKIQNL